MTIQVPIIANDRTYAAPKICAIAICLDGCEPAYLDEAIAAGLMPNLKRIKETGTVRLAHSVVPSFTNPNNMSIATGHPPAVHGICGNYLYDPETKTEVMMNDVRFLRAPTIFHKFQEGGARVAVVTAKDKLRALLGAGLTFDSDTAICFSAERSDATNVAEHGIDNASEWLGMDVPEVYSAGLSEFVFAAGVKLLAEWKPDVMYLTTTDFVQHKYAPGEPEANDFFKMFDVYLGQLDEMGAAVVITGDHGMKPKHHADGSPNVIYIQDQMDEWLGVAAARVILPITDPYVVHHGALGSFATIYLEDKSKIGDAMEEIKKIKEIEVVVSNEAGCEEYDLPKDRMGDIICMSSQYMTIGSSESSHDLSKLKEPLRSHGGLHEREVPFISNKKINSFLSNEKLNNYDAFYYAIAGAM